MNRVLAMAGGFRGFVNRIHGDIPFEFLASQAKRFQDAPRPVFFFLLDLSGFFPDDFSAAVLAGELLLFFGFLSRPEGLAEHFWRQILDSQPDQFRGGRFLHAGSDLALFSGTADKRHFGRVYPRHRGGAGERFLEVKSLAQNFKSARFASRSEKDEEILAAKPSSRTNHGKSEE